MTLYRGTKTVKANPMNRAEYNIYRGWELPANENGADKGYLVEYTDGGKPNDPRHEGYISWSPMDVFDAAYKPVTSEEAKTDEDVTAFGSIDALATVVYNWHTHGVKMVKHMMEIPEGVEMTYADEGVATTMTLEGNVLLAFKAGVAQALAELGTLPFYAELEDGTNTETNESKPDEPNA